MIEMEMENERVERLRLQVLGEGWIQAITAGTLERLGQFCHPGIVSQLLIPKRLVTLDNAVDLVAMFRQWFGECTDIQLEKSRIRPVGERLGIFYCFHLQEQGGWFTVEQQLYCSFKDGRIAQLHLLCSGFQPLG